MGMIILKCKIRVVFVRGWIKEDGVINGRRRDYYCMGGIFLFNLWVYGYILIIIFFYIYGNFNLFVIFIFIIFEESEIIWNMREIIIVY